MTNRTKVAYVNSSIALVTNIIQILLGFIIRRIFIKSLGVAYLGYNSVFTNILQMLNLADLGIGVAITSFLYKPLADKDDKKLFALMVFYKKIYRTIGLVVLLLGLIISLFLDILVPDAKCSSLYLKVLFYINLMGTVSTYFLAYKRTLIIADQKSYITNITDTVVFFVISGLQIITLLFIPNYILFLLLTVLRNIISNVILSLKCDKLYGKFNGKSDEHIIGEYKGQIIRYVKDVFVSRVGATVYYGTDNVILSVLKGSLLTGYLSNYTLITSHLNTIVTQILQSIQATFGNYVHSNSDKNAQSKMTNTYFCANFVIGNFCFVCFALLAQPFVSFFFGEDMLLESSTAILLGINLMLSTLSKLPSQVFAIYKLYGYDKPIVIVAALLNILISVALVFPLGINGVLIGTFITSIIYLVSRFYIISKYVFQNRYSDYLKVLSVYGIISCITYFTSKVLADGIPGNSFFSFLVRLAIIGFTTIVVSFMLLSFKEEFINLLIKIFPGQYNSDYTTRKLRIICGISILILALIRIVTSGVLA